MHSSQGKHSTCLRQSDRAAARPRMDLRSVSHRRKEGRMDGRKEVKEGRMEGRTEGVNKGREEGRKQRREEKSGFL